VSSALAVPLGQDPVVGGAVGLPPLGIGDRSDRATDEQPCRRRSSPAFVVRLPERAGRAFICLGR
jgi:hypothetical protein